MGRYIAFVDPDDYVSMNYYENMFKVMEEYGADIVESKSKLMAEDGRLIAERATEAIASFSGMNSLVVADGKGEIMDRITDNTFNCLSWNKLFKKSLWGDARYPKNLSLGEDMAIVPEVVTRASKAVYTPNSVYFYRLRNTSLLHSNVNSERFKEDLQGSGIMRDALLSASPENKEKIEGLKTYYDVGCLFQYLKQNRKQQSI